MDIGGEGIPSVAGGDRDGTTWKQGGLWKSTEKRKECGESQGHKLRNRSYARVDFQRCEDGLNAGLAVCFGCDDWSRRRVCLWRKGLVTSEFAISSWGRAFHREFWYHCHRTQLRSGLVSRVDVGVVGEARQDGSVSVMWIFRQEWRSESTVDGGNYTITTVPRQISLG